MILIKDASKEDILESKRRIKERQNQRRLDRDAKQAIDIVNKHRKESKRNEHYSVCNDWKRFTTGSIVLGMLGFIFGMACYIGIWRSDQHFK